MSWSGGIMVYVVIFCLTIFLVLPWGVIPVDEEDIKKGHASSAPKNPRILLKLAINSVLAGVCWLGFRMAMEAGLITLRL